MIGSTLWMGAALLALMGAPLAALGLFFRLRHAGFNRRAVQVDGVVIGVREHRVTSTSIRRWVYFPTVRYTAADGRELEAVAPGEDEPPPDGTRIPLIYDADHPDQVSFTGPRGAAGVATGIAGLGCATCLCALAAAVAALVVTFL
jgi:hypothetical protein